MGKMIGVKITPIILTVSLVLTLGACRDQNQKSGGQTSSTTSATQAASKPLCQDQPAAPTGLSNSGVTDLKTQDLTVGTGREAKAGDSVEVHYIGRLVNGTKFDSSCDRNQPFPFQLGAGMVIQGWDQGVAGMKEGGKRRLIIPSRLGYGPQGFPPVIPQNAALVFDVELVKVK